MILVIRGALCAWGVKSINVYNVNRIKLFIRDNASILVRKYKENRAFIWKKRAKIVKNVGKIVRFVGIWRFVIGVWGISLILGGFVWRGVLGGIWRIWREGAV